MSHLSFFTGNLVPSRCSKLICAIHYLLNGYSVLVEWMDYKDEWIHELLAFLHATLCKIFDTSPYVCRGKKSLIVFWGTCTSYLAFIPNFQKHGATNKCQFPFLYLTARQFVITNLKASPLFCIFFCIYLPNLLLRT